MRRHGNSLLVGERKGEAAWGNCFLHQKLGTWKQQSTHSVLPPVFSTSLKLDTKIKFMGFGQRDMQLLCCENYYCYNFIYADNDIFRILCEFWIKFKFSFIAVLRIFGVTVSYGKCNLSEDFLAECNC